MDIFELSIETVSCSGDTHFFYEYFTTEDELNKRIEDINEDSNICFSSSKVKLEEAKKIMTVENYERMFGKLELPKIETFENTVSMQSHWL